MKNKSENEIVELKSKLKKELREEFKKIKSDRSKKKYTNKRIELYSGIINDIAEGIDCFNSKEDYRGCISWLADELMHCNNELTALKDSLMFAKFDLMMTAIKNDK